MYIIKLNAIDSTNTYLKDLMSAAVPKDYTVVIAAQQTKGKGQMGAQWYSENGRNLTASVFKSLPYFDVSKQFYISMAVSLAVYKTLGVLKIPKLHIKWPNDILSANFKIGGILIENVIKNNKLIGSVIGLGINVNQKSFNNLPKASSMSLITGIFYNLDEVLSELLVHLKIYFDILESKAYASLKLEYESHLFRKNKPSTFEQIDGYQFSGIIKGVTENGHLKILLEDEIVKTYNFKEVKLLY